MIYDRFRIKWTEKTYDHQRHKRSEISGIMNIRDHEYPISWIPVIMDISYRKA